MSSSGFSVSNLLICFVIFEACFGIILKSQDLPKPAYSSGIKTTSWRSPNSIQTHQNYSKVYVHNNPANPSQYAVATAEKSEKVYPIYNAHSYGQQPAQTQRIVDNSRLGNSNRNRTEGYIPPIYPRHYFPIGPFGEVVGGAHKNRTIYKRKIEYKVIEVFEKCPDGATGSFVFYLSCNQFLNCWKGRGEVQNCAPGTLFNPKTLECDFPDKVECITGRQNSLSYEPSRSQKSVVQARCPKEFSGLIPNYTDCSKFINCNNGYETSMDCPPGTLFDVAQNICNYPHLTTCFSGESGSTFRQNGSDRKYGTQQQNQKQSNNWQQTNIQGRVDNNQNQGRLYNYNQGQNQYQGQDYQGQFDHNQYQGQHYQGQQGQITGQYEAHHQGQYRPGGQYYQTNYSQPYGQLCNLATGVCVYPPGQGRQTGVQYHQQGQYGQQGFGSTVDQQNSFQHGINSNIDFGAGSTRGTPNQGHSFATQTSSNCNPAIQKCDQVPATTYSQVYGYSYNSNCDPRVQNCVLSSGIGTSQTSGTGTTLQSNDQQGATNIFGYNSNCDPRVQNCALGSGIGTSRTDDTASHTYDQQETANTFGYNSGQQNFHRICNINDRNCQSITTEATAKKSKEPKCPNNFQGITKHPTDCKKFLNCANGRTFIQDCAPGTLFNPTIGNCDFPYNVDCSTGETEESSTEYYSSSTERSWDRNYQEHVEQYGQNAGHGNIRATTTLSPHGTNQGFYNQGQVQNTYNQEHVQNTYTQGQRGHNNGQWYPTNQLQHQNNQGQATYQYERGQLTPNQGSHSTGIQTTHGWNQRGSSSGVTILQPLTPRPNTNTYETVINRGETGQVSRPSHFKIDLTNKRNNARDYIDVFDPNEPNEFPTHSTTSRSTGKWPPPFPSTDVNADYVFEYEDGEPVTLQPENVFNADKKKMKKADCGKGDFYCSDDMCVSKTAVCDGHRDCSNGKDELGCQEYLKSFTLKKNSQLNVLEDQRWINVSQATCALLCIRSSKIECKSINYRKMDRTCFLSSLNIGLTGSLRDYYPFDYYELTSSSIDCTLMFKCNDDKCINNHQVCDGFGDCSGREDEKNCRAEDFGYSIRLAGMNKNNEGRVEITAFGKTGYICDDQFGIKDANVICRELGFQLGAAEIKGHSSYATDIQEKNTEYMIDDLDCIGNETTLLDCNFPGWGVHNCRDQEIAGLVCKTHQAECGKDSWKCDSNNECIPQSFVCDGLFDCTDNSDEGVQHCEAPVELRLVNGSTNKEGRVEIKHHGSWGTICDDDFNEDAAKLVCKYFGFKGAAIVKKDSYFGGGDGPIWLDQVSCIGNETELRDCTNWNWGEHNCDHNEDVGVICSNEVRVEEIQLQRHSKVDDRYVDYTGHLVSTCGYTKDNQFLENDLIHARVVEGGIARKGDYPWQAALRIKGKAQKSHHWCGAVILSSRWVLTAAHCLLGYAKGAYMIVAGEYNTDEEEGTEQVKYIEEYFIHGNFTEGNRVMKNDIALIKVKGTGFSLTGDVQAICLPDGDSDYERDLNCTISGFGSVKTGNSAYSHNLMAAWVPIIKSDICKMPHVYDTAMSDGMICAGFLSGGVDSCHGDSGGPLACLDNGVFTVYGITSWGHRCGFANKPGVYVKVAHYRQWIDDTIKDNS